MLPAARCTTPKDGPTAYNACWGVVVQISPLVRQKSYLCNFYHKSKAQRHWDTQFSPQHSGTLQFNSVAAAIKTRNSTQGIRSHQNRLIVASCSRHINTSGSEASSSPGDDASTAPLPSGVSPSSTDAGLELFKREIGDKRFTCTLCGKCCTGKGEVWVSEPEALKIAQYLDITLDGFLHRCAKADLKGAL